MFDLSRAYVELAHAIEVHYPGYIDGYFGPPEWRVTEQRPLEELASDAVLLAEAASGLDAADRRSFLQAQVGAMQTTIALLQGEEIPYKEEVRRLYGIEPVWAAEERFDEAIRRLEELLPPVPAADSIAAREQAFRKQFEVGVERLSGLLDIIVNELGERARERFPLPSAEAFEVQLVRNEPWGAYNWYLGEYRSRIDVNTDLPLHLHALPDLIAHEAYPGHHTEHAIKEQRLYRELGRGEHAILLINAPECVVSEGIAVRARRMVMDDDELRDWLKRELLDVAGLHGADIDTMLAVNETKQDLRAVTGNAALLLHEEGASEEEVLRYLERYRLATPAEAAKSLQFITHPNFRSYIFTYTAGGELLDRLFERGDVQERFARLLSEPVTPKAIRQWVEG